MYIKVNLFDHEPFSITVLGDCLEQLLIFFVGEGGTEIDSEFKKLQDTFSAKGKNEIDTKLKPSEVLRKALKSKPLFKGVKIIYILLISKGLSGMGAVASYYQTIFDESGGSIKSIYSVMIIGVVTLLSTSVTSQLVERLGRRILALAGFSFMSLSLNCLATYFLVKEKGNDMSSLSWIPIASLVIFTMAYNLQDGIAWILLTDICCSDIIDVLSSIASFLMFSLAFATTLAFPYLKDVVGNYGTFCIFGGCTACSVVFVFLYIPETKGKSIEEVLEILDKK